MHPNAPKEAECPHTDFKGGICTQCGWKCEHEESEDYHCLDCGESTFDPDYADYLHEQEKDRQAEEGL